MVGRRGGAGDCRRCRNRQAARRGTRVFPLSASVAAPLWVLERGVCAWLACAARLAWGGIPYSGRIISRAATPYRILQARLKDA